jgi:hypothetical protein
MEDNSATDDEAEVFHSIEMLSRDETSVWGRMKSGNFNITSEFRNMQTKQIDFERKPEHAEEIPYYFQFHMPKGSDRGVLVTQRLGIYGIHTALKKIVHECVSNHGLILDLDEAIPPEVYEYLKRGSMSQVVFNHVTIPEDLLRLVDWKTEDIEDLAEIKLIVKSKKGKFLPMSNKLRGRYTSLIEKREVSSDTLSKEVEVVVDYAGNKRTVKLNKPDSFSPMIDVTKDLEMQGNIPTFESIHNSANTLIGDIVTMVRGE